MKIYEFRNSDSRTENFTFAFSFVDACAAAGVPVDMRMQSGYDHSYYFIATFMGDHMTHHAKALNRL